MKIKSVIVVGSGASAVHAAFPIVEAGIPVTMIDVGYEDRKYEDIIPKKPFAEIRRNEKDQYRYFLGDQLEGLQFGDITVGAQLTPPRQFITALTEKLTPVKSDSFFSMESLAAGGLARGWGAGCFPYTDRELARMHLSRALLNEHYAEVAQRIGVSGADDDLIPFYEMPLKLQPPLEIDANAQSIQASYLSRSGEFKARGFALGRAHLAVLSQPLAKRTACRYLDMEFWGDLDQSVYRPTYTLEELKERPHFKYLDGYLVERFTEKSGEVIVGAYNTRNRSREEFRADFLVIAAGTFGTTRIVLRALERFETKVPLVSNPYTYVPMVNIRRLGKPDTGPRYGLTQLCAVYHPEDSTDAMLHGQLYSYRSLLNYKLMKEIPLPFRASIRLVKMLLSGFCILGIHHEDRPSDKKYSMLHKSKGTSPDVLEIEFALDQKTLRQQEAMENRMLSCFRKLGCYTLKKIHNGSGSSIHYAGTFPISLENRELTVTSECLLRPTNNVYLADGSVFPYLPAKGPTYSFMANANRVGSIIRDRLRDG